MDPPSKCHETHFNQEVDEGRLTALEEKLVVQFDAEPNLEEALIKEKEHCKQRLWSAFQNNAAAVAQLYKEGIAKEPSWPTFRNAASTVTILYKEGGDQIKLISDLAYASGQQKKTRDILSWLRKNRRRFIRREDLICILLGKTPPLRSKSSISSSSASPSVRRRDSNLRSNSEADFQVFQEALALHGLNGAMSNICVGGGRRSSSSPSSHRLSPNRSLTTSPSRDWWADPDERVAPRDRKRGCADSDSPSTKRSRLH